MARITSPPPCPNHSNIAKYLWVILPVAGWLGLLSCGQAPAEKVGERQPGPVELVFETRTLERRAADCETSPADCGRIELSWVEITEAPAGVARAVLNEWVRTALMEPPLGEEAPSSPQGLADEFIANYEQFRRDFEDADLEDTVGGWTVERTVEEIYRDELVVSFRDVESSRTGGEPVRREHYATLYLTTGMPVIQEHLLVEGSRERLIEIAEASFRRARGLDPGADLREAGFRFEDGFELPESFAITAEGLVYYYNPSEVAPHPMGPTTVKIPRAELAGVVQWPG